MLAAVLLATAASAEDIDREEWEARLCERAEWLRLSHTGFVPDGAPVLPRGTAMREGQRLWESCDRFAKKYGDPSRCCARVRGQDPGKAARIQGLIYAVFKTEEGSPERVALCEEFREVTGGTVRPECYASLGIAAPTPFPTPSMDPKLEAKVAKQIALIREPEWPDQRRQLCGELSQWLAPYQRPLPKECHPELH